jgi:hypothetical protein
MDSNRQRLLATMPLHAITATYGEKGLEDRFKAEIASFKEPDRNRLRRALDLAARLHADDRRQREPYLNHLLRVAIRIMAYYSVRDIDVICAALLHDSVEDHADELADGQESALAVLVDEFGPRVAKLVAAVTNPEWSAARDRHEQYREHVADSLGHCPWARVIKASDFTDNGVGIIHTTGPMADRLAVKYAPLVPVLRELIKRDDTPLDTATKEHILGQLDLAAERFTALLPSQGHNDSLSACHR